MVKFAVRVMSPIKDDKTEFRFYGDSFDEVREFLRNNCIFYKFVLKESSGVDNSKTIKYAHD